MAALIASAVIAMAGDGTILITTFGATSRDARSKVTRYLADKDSVALWELINLGSATVLDSGQKVHLVDTAIFSGLVKVRVQGDTREYWIPIEHYKADEPPSGETKKEGSPALLPQRSPGGPSRSIQGPVRILGPVPADMKDDFPDEPVRFVGPERVPAPVRKIVSKVQGVISYKVHFSRGRYGVIYTVAQSASAISPEHKQRLEKECRSVWKQLKNSSEAISSVAYESSDGKLICLY